MLALGIARMAGLKIYLSYQLSLIADLIRNRNSVLKMPRQTGKTWCAAVIACAYLLLRVDVMVAYPTLIQGHKLLLTRIVEILRACRIGVVRFNTHGIELANGARVHVVSTNEQTTSNEGFTVGCLIVDEAHKCSQEKFKDMLPSLKIFLERGWATVILCGIQGARQSMIEVAYRERGFKLEHIKTPEILAKYPGYQVSLDVFKQMLSPEEYAEQIDCVHLGGLRSIFHHLLTPLPAHCLRQQYIDVVGVDVGQQVDATLVSWLKYYPSGQTPHIEIFQTMRLTDKYPIQGKKILAFLRANDLQRAPVGFEINGIGRGLYDIVSAQDKYDEDPISNVQGFVCTARSKAGVIKWLQSIDRARCLHATDEQMYLALETLEEEKTPEGKMKYDHSDHLSSLIVGAAMVGYG
jgi:hypothetical protein